MIPILLVLQLLVAPPDAVVVGNVTSVQAVTQTTERGDRIIVSQVTVHVVEKIRGNITGDTVVIDIPGGTVGSLSMAASGQRVPQRGQYIVASLRNRGQRVKLSRADGWEPATPEAVQRARQGGGK